MATTKQIERHVTSLGLTYSAAFVPHSKSKHAKDPMIRTCLNWQVLLSHGDKSLLFDYTQGMDSLPTPKLKQLKGLDTKGLHRVTACEKGVYLGEPLRAPLLRDILYKLTLDADVLNWHTFNDWCVEYGYATNSVKSARLYKERVLQARAFAALVGCAALYKLQALFMGY